MQDILIDGNNVLQVASGDFVIGQSDNQHQLLLLKTSKGEWKENPDVGADILNFLEDEDKENMYAEIKRQFGADGITINTLRINPEGNIEIDANY